MGSLRSRFPRPSRVPASAIILSMMVAACGTASSPQPATTTPEPTGVRAIKLSDSRDPVRPTIADCITRGDAHDRRDRPGGRVPARRRRRHDPGDGRRRLGVRPDGRAADRSRDEHVDPCAAHGGGWWSERPRRHRAFNSTGSATGTWARCVATTRQPVRSERRSRLGHPKESSRPTTGYGSPTIAMGRFRASTPNRTRSPCRSKSAGKAIAGRVGSSKPAATCGWRSRMNTR